MAHAPAFPTHSVPRHTGQTRLALDGTRIAANAGAIAINAVALMLLLAPVVLAPPAPLPVRVTDVSWVRPQPEPTPVAMPVVPKTEPRHLTRAAQPRPAATTSPRPVVDSQPGDATVPATDPAVDAEPGDTVDLTSQRAASAQLQAVSAPSPRYPPEAIRAGMSGTVELEILVGIDGAPLEVRVV